LGIAENIPNRSILNILKKMMKNYIFKTKLGDKKNKFYFFYEHYEIQRKDWTWNCNDEQ